uniref:Uncharacterized protein n=2 Tax=Aegilops tauschii subsp. strangulata TaxID=200361 RepID=A0A453R3T0_AEGTS
LLLIKYPKYPGMQISPAGCNPWRTLVTIPDAMVSSRCAVLPHPAGVAPRRRQHLPAQAFWGTERRRRRRLVSFEAPPRCHKMYVPGFGEGSPEKKAAISLLNFFNYLAVRIVLAQLEVTYLLIPLIISIESLRFSKSNTILQ